MLLRFLLLPIISLVLYSCILSDDSGSVDRDYSVSLNSARFGQGFDSVVVVITINDAKETIKFCSDDDDCRVMNYDSKSGANTFQFEVSANAGQKVTVSYTCFISDLDVVAVLREFIIDEEEPEDINEHENSTTNNVIYINSENSFILEELSTDLELVSYSEFEQKLLDKIVDAKSSDTDRKLYFTIYEDSEFFKDDVEENRELFIKRIIDEFLDKRNNKPEFEDDLFAFIGDEYDDSKEVLSERFYSGDYELDAHNGIAKKLEEMDFFSQDSMIYYEAERLHKNVDDLDDTSFEEMSIAGDFFSIANFEVTHELWGRINSDFDFEVDEERYPVANISFFDVAVFCNDLSEEYNYKEAYQFDSISGVGDERAFWNNDTIGFEIDLESDGFRLPTEVEWETAYSKRNSGAYFWTVDESTADNKEEYGEFVISGSRVDVVDTKFPSMANLYHMAGNVAEMVHPRIPYKISTSVVLKGGHFDSDPVAWKWSNSEQPSIGFTTVGDTIGFRLARTGW
ncbi:MAG: formylglycine-generating enzyme family protein [Fibrobacterales bacterium]